MDATIIIRSSVSGYAPPRKKVEIIAEVRFDVRHAPDLRVGDEISLKVFGSLKEIDPPVVKLRRYVGNSLHIFCGAYPILLHKLARHRGAKLKRKETRGFKEIQYYELPTQDWV